MLRKWGIIILIALILVGSGGYLVAKDGHNQKNYDQAMTLGRQNLTHQNYSVALTNFNRSLVINPHAKKTRQLSNQVQYYVAGKQNLKLLNLNLAQHDFNQSLLTRGHSVILRKQSIQELSQIKKLQSQLTKLSHVYNLAIKVKQHAHYQKSNQILKLALSDYRNRQPFLDSTMSQMKNLKSYNNTLIKLQKKNH